MLHEAVNFNPMDRRWYFLPRRVSSDPYNDVEDERRGSNLLLSTDSNMKDLKISQLGVSITLFIIIITTIINQSSFTTATQPHTWVFLIQILALERDGISGFEN